MTSNRSWRHVIPFVPRSGILPGYPLAATFALGYLAILVLIPLASLLFRATHIGSEQFVAAVTGERAMAAYRLSFGASFIAAIVNAVMGLVVAWVLARYRFPMKTFVDALVDVPFALPTAVAGVALTAVYAGNGWVGQFLEPRGIQIAFAPLGVQIALIFVGIPFVVRTVEPVLQDLDPAIEEAAAVLGASRLRTFRSVILPALLPAMLTGFALAFARALGEYGSVVFISGNLPLRTEIVPLLIVTKLEQYDYDGATAIAAVMLVSSFVLLVLIHAIQAKARKGKAA